MVQRGYASVFTRAETVKILRRLEVPDALKNPSSEAYPMSSKADEYFKLSKKAIYKKLINGDFVCSPPEITKTRQGTSCWQHGFQLVLEQEDRKEGDDATYLYTGYLIHQAEDKKEVYCG